LKKTINNSQELITEFFETIPDSLLVRMATNDWKALRSICIALTLDLQLIEEQKEKDLEN
jgi:hypothetical protein